MQFSRLTLAFAFSTLAGAALAADLPSRKVEPALSAPAFSWTGFYVGLNAGVGLGDGGVDGYQPLVANTPTVLNAEGGRWSFGDSKAGLTIGGQLGYNYQLSRLLVLGAEADFQYFGRSRQNIANASYFSYFWGVNSTAGVAVHDSNSWFGTVRGRVGVTPFAPNFMIYATGGLAYGRVGHSLAYQRSDNVPPSWTFVGSGAVSSTRLGWTAGAGVEWAGLFSPNVSLKLEWLYTNLGSSTQTDLHNASITSPPGVYSITRNRTTNSFQTFRAGVNYRFNWGAAAPIVASY